MTAFLTAYDGPLSGGGTYTDRICRVCPLKAIETEEHFLTECAFFTKHRTKFDVYHIDDPVLLMNETDPQKLGKFLTECFSDRQKFIDWFY